VLHNPMGYLEERGRWALAQLSITQRSFSTFQMPPDDAQNIPLSPSLQADGMSYLNAFSVGDGVWGDPLYDVWIYLVIVIAAIPLLVIRRRGADSAVVALCAGTLVFLAALIFTAPDLGYRFAYPIVVVGCVVLPVLWPRQRMPAESDETTGDLTTADHVDEMRDDAEAGDGDRTLLPTG
jgi:hypothetical protein